MVCDFFERMVKLAYEDALLELGQSDVNVTIVENVNIEHNEVDADKPIPI